MSRWDRLCTWLRGKLPDSHTRVKDLPSFEAFEGYGDPEAYHVDEEE